MKMNRSQAREKIMIILYQIDFYIKNNIEYNADDVIKENLEIDNNYVREIVNGVISKNKELDEKIGKYLVSGWTIDRLGKTDKAILRLAAYEIMFYDTPNAVAVNEAIILAKKYSDDKVVKLINAVLDKIIDEEE